MEKPPAATDYNMSYGSITTAVRVSRRAGPIVAARAYGCVYVCMYVCQGWVLKSNRRTFAAKKPIGYSDSGRMWNTKSTRCRCSLTTRFSVGQAAALCGHAKSMKTSTFVVQQRQKHERATATFWLIGLAKWVSIFARLVLARVPTSCFSFASRQAKKHRGALA